MRPESQLSPPAFNQRATKRMMAALRSGQWANGPRALDIERRIGERIGVHPECVVATSSASVALAAATTILTVDRARVCPLTWPATYSSSAIPEWVDCLPGNPAPESEVDIGVDLWGRQGRYLLTERSKGAGGIAQDSDGVGRESIQCPRIIDAAHRFGDPIHGALLRAGSGAVFAVVYSFAPQKEVPCWGGGALACRSKTMAKHCRTLLSGGIEARVWSGIVGSKG